MAKYKISQERFDIESSTLSEAGFRSDLAESLIIRQSSNNTVKAVLNSYKTLLAQPYALKHQQIILIASHHGGSKNIEAVQRHYQILLAKDYSKEELLCINLLDHVNL